MTILQETHLLVERAVLQSAKLKRDVVLDIFLPTHVPDPSQISILFINDGQDLATMNFKEMLEGLYAASLISPVLCVGITAGMERTMEYGVASGKDYMGRGAKAKNYTRFVLKELLPYIKKTYQLPVVKEIAFAGFSLGGLSALDIVWSHSDIFSRAGIFSGSLWWRSVDQDSTKYNDNKHRIMQQQIRRGRYKKGLSFFFQCGKLDEGHDRNHNGIIDAVDDTIDHIHELLQKGYTAADIAYLELEDGRHDVPSWGRAMPAFLIWAYGRER